MNPSRWVAVAGTAAVLCVVLGFAASLGHGPLPPLPAPWVAPLHLVLALAGFASGRVAARRQAEIEARRAEYLGDPHATKGERETAFKDAERDLRFAHMALIGAPLALGYWLAYELAPGAPPWGRALPASALVGYGLSLLVGGRRDRG